MQPPHFGAGVVILNSGRLQIRLSQLLSPRVGNQADELVEAVGFAESIYFGLRTPLWRWINRTRIRPPSVAISPPSNPP